MNSQQLQTAIDQYLTVVVEKGSTLKNYQPRFYEQLCSVTLKLMQLQVTRAGMITAPSGELKGKP